MKSKRKSVAEDLRPEYEFDYSKTIRGKYYRPLLIDDLTKKKDRLITLANPEWARALTLQNLVAREFSTQGFLSSSTFGAVLDWKLRKQLNRTEERRLRNTDELIKELTTCFWRVRHSDENIELTTKLGVLMVIPGTGIGVASAIMALCDPAKFGVIDYRGWRVLYGQDKRQFSAKDYRKYLTDIRYIAREIGCNAQEVDYLLWKEFETIARR